MTNTSGEADGDVSALFTICSQGVMLNFLEKFLLVVFMQTQEGRSDGACRFLMTRRRGFVVANNVPRAR